MTFARTTNVTKNKKSKATVRLSADRSIVDKAVKALSAFQDAPHAKPAAPELGFCFVKTSLGVLQIDVFWLLILVGGIIRRDDNAGTKGSPIEIELTEDVLDAAVETIRAIPRYIERDLLGIFFEAQFMLEAKDVQNPKLREIGIDRPYTFEKLCKLLFVHGAKREIIHLKLLGDGLAAGGIPFLSVPEITEAFVTAISEHGPVGAKPWRKFIEQHFREKHARGRRREQLYDNLFKKRTENPSLSYGMLAREVAKSKNIEFTVARDQVKAAIAYRRRKTARSK